jgi:exodeoxyribonuclease VII small subunit
MAEKNKKFEDNFMLLESVAKDLQSGQVSVDDLVPKMKEAAKAMSVCKEVLKSTKIRIQEIEKEIAGVLEEVEEEADK